VPLEGSLQQEGSIPCGGDKSGEGNGPHFCVLEL
jgi:hypothetical protein